MDDAAKAMITNELMGIKGMLSGVNSQISGLNVTMYPVAGPNVIINSLPMAGNAIRTQNECIDKLLRVIDKLLHHV